MEQQSKVQMRESDGDAIQRALRGDGDGFRVLVERYSQNLFRLAYRMTGNEQDAEDVVQETFLKAYRSLAGYDGRSSFSTWMYRVAANTALDLLAARKKRSVVLPLETNEDGEAVVEAREDGPGPERLAMSGQVQAQLALAMEALTPQERTAFVLRHFEECSVEEISGALGLGQSSTRHSIFRAVKKLRRALAPVVGAGA
jgi:RNA polymerase sigma-70 factor (ECF subfamily)